MIDDRVVFEQRRQQQQQQRGLTTETRNSELYTRHMSIVCQSAISSIFYSTTTLNFLTLKAVSGPNASMLILCDHWQRQLHTPVTLQRLCHISGSDLTLIQQLNENYQCLSIYTPVHEN